MSTFADAAHLAPIDLVERLVDFAENLGVALGEVGARLFSADVCRFLQIVAGVGHQGGLELFLRHKVSGWQPQRQSDCASMGIA